MHTCPCIPARPQLLPQGMRDHAFGALEPKSSQHARLVDVLCTSRQFLRGTSSTLGAERRLTDAASGGTALALMPPPSRPSLARGMSMGVGMGSNMPMGSLGNTPLRNATYATAAGSISANDAQHAGDGWR